MVIEQGPHTSGCLEAGGFVQRALLDFGLMDAFKLRSTEECIWSLNWVAAAADAEDEEERVSRLLDGLASGTALPGSTENSPSQP